MFKRLRHLLTPPVAPSLEVRLTMETRVVHPSELSERDHFGNQISDLRDTYDDINEVTGRWIPNTIRKCEAVIGDHGKLRSYECKAIKKLTGAEVATYHQAAAALIDDLRRLEAAGMAEPYDVRRKKEQAARKAAKEAAKKSKST